MFMRVQYHFFVPHQLFFLPHQLAAYDQDPGLITAAYASVGTGTMLLRPAVLELARRIGATHPRYRCHHTIAVAATSVHGTAVRRRCTPGNLDEPGAPGTRM